MMTWWQIAIVVWAFWAVIGFFTCMGSGYRISRFQQFLILGFVPIAWLAAGCMIAGRWLFVADED